MSSVDPSRSSISTTCLSGYPQGFRGFCSYDVNFPKLWHVKLESVFWHWKTSKLQRDLLEIPKPVFVRTYENKWFIQSWYKCFCTRHDMIQARAPNWVIFIYSPIYSWISFIKNTVPSVCQVFSWRNADQTLCVSPTWLDQTSPCLKSSNARSDPTPQFAGRQKTMPVRERSQSVCPYKPHIVLC